MFCIQPSKNKFFLAFSHRKQDVLFQCEFLIPYLNKITKHVTDEENNDSNDVITLNCGTGGRERDGEKETLFSTVSQGVIIKIVSLDNRIVLLQPLLCNIIIKPLFGGPCTFLFLLSSTSSVFFISTFVWFAKTRNVKTLWRTAVLLVGSSVEEVFRMS